MTETPENTKQYIQLHLKLHLQIDYNIETDTFQKQ